MWSRRSGGLAALALALAGVAACGTSTAPGIDAAPLYGEVELGTGVIEFEAIPGGPPAPELPLVAGPQGGHHFVVNARMREMQPGDPESPGLATNPQTLFSAFALEEGGGERQIDLRFPAYHLGYEDGADGWFTFTSGRTLQVAETELPALYGGEVRIRLDVIDAAGVRGIDERVVTAIEDLTAPDAGPPPGGPFVPDSGP
jgi:hypothetical protein